MDEYLSILNKAQCLQSRGIRDRARAYGSAERFLQRSIEAINDMASHVIADNELSTITVKWRYTEIIPSL